MHEFLQLIALCLLLAHACNVEWGLLAYRYLPELGRAVPVDHPRLATVLPRGAASADDCIPHSRRDPHDARNRPARQPPRKPRGW